MSNLKFTIVFVFAFCCISVFCVAQPGCPPGGCPGGDPGNNAPITGVEYLLGLGALLGIKKIMKIRFKKA